MSHGILVFIEQKGGTANRSSLEAIAAAQSFGSQLQQTVSAVVLGAFVIQAKVLTIIWRLNIDNWMGMSRWQAWVTLGIIVVAAIFGLVLGFRFDWHAP